MSTLENLCTTWNSSPRGQKDRVNLADIICKIKGMNTDHAEDQKKLVRLFLEAKRQRYTDASIQHCTADVPTYGTELIAAKRRSVDRMKQPNKGSSGTSPHPGIPGKACWKSRNGGRDRIDHTPSMPARYSDS